MGRTVNQLELLGPKDFTQANKNTVLILAL